MRRERLDRLAGVLIMLRDEKLGAVGNRVTWEFRHQRLPDGNRLQMIERISAHVVFLALLVPAPRPIVHLLAIATHPEAFGEQRERRVVLAFRRVELSDL